MTFIILHKVRGEPAFDVAERCDDMGTEDDPGPWWIIPTSGHRAHPYKSWPLEWFHPAGSFEIPDDWPDHYQTEDTGTITTGINVMAIISKTLTKIKRRL